MLWIEHTSPTNYFIIQLVSRTCSIAFEIHSLVVVDAPFKLFAKTFWLFSLKIITGCRLNMTEVDELESIFRELDDSCMMHIIVSRDDQLPFWPPIYNSGPHMFLQSFSFVIVNKKIYFTLCMIASIIVDYVWLESCPHNQDLINHQISVYTNILGCSIYINWEKNSLSLVTDLFLYWDRLHK